jgi:hypothetical protein
LTCSVTYVMITCSLFHPHCHCWHQCIDITLTALELFLLHVQFNHCTLANKCQRIPHSYSTEQKHTSREIFSKHAFIPKSNCGDTHIAALLPPSFFASHYSSALSHILHLSSR